MRCRTRVGTRIVSRIGRTSAFKATGYSPANCDPFPYGPGSRVPARTAGLGRGPAAWPAGGVGGQVEAQAGGVRERAEAGGGRVEQALTPKGGSFGRIAAGPDGTLDYGAVEGVDP